MKRALYYYISSALIAALLIAGLLATCHTRSKPGKEGLSEVPPDTAEVNPDTVAVVQDTVAAEPDAKVIGWADRGRPYVYVDSDSNYIYYPRASDTIVGRFRRGVVDTLVREPIWERGIDDTGPEWWFWRVRSVKGSVADIYFINRLWVYFCNAGDLDDNGTDEICVLCQNYSNFTHYNVITYRKGEWRTMTEPLYAHQAVMFDYSIEDYVSKSDRPGYINAKVTRDIWIGDSDRVGVELVDSLVKIKRDGEVYNPSRSFQAYF